MKKLTKILALALAVAMMLGMTSMAANVYYTQNFDFVDKTELQANTAILGTDLPTINQTATPIDFATIKNSGKNIAIKAYNTSGNAFFDMNATVGSTGNKYAENISTSMDFPVYFVPNVEWTANANEVYVIAYDYEIESGDTRANYTHIGMIGKNTSDEYVVVPIAAWAPKAIFSLYSSFKNDENGGDGGLFATPGEELAEGEEKIHEAAPTGTKPYSIKFEINEDGGLKRSAYTNDIHGGYTRFYADSTFLLGDISSVAALAIRTRDNNAAISDIRMYTMDPNEAFTATSVMNGATEVSHKTNKVTLVFNQPVALAKVAVTANGKNVEGVTTAIRQVVSNGSIYSEVDVNFASDLSLETEYSIDLSGVKNDIGVACSSDPITFTTLDAPDATFTAYEGLKESQTTISEYAGKTVYVKAQATNNTANAFNGKLIIGIYDVATGDLVKYASATRTLDVSGTTTFGASFKVAAGQTIRAEFK